ncbi:lysophospholipid acyltransferase family protein [Streptomyces sp. NPDC029006]|uniref:lysophospholipid acyltransferase family protein n=1 Tax=Streptomyces sp. NPDC029006 TaxID=3155467 RepID=UPI0033F5E301
MPRRRIGFWYRFAAVLCKPPLVVLIKRDWRGMEHIPAEGGFITVVNHNSHVDPFAYAHYQYNTGRVPRFLAKSGLFRKGFVGAAMRGTGQIPVYRESTDALSAFRAAIAAVERGECVAFYPEGTLTRDPDGWPMTAKTGAARVALQTKCPVIPVAQWGANELLPPYARKPNLFPRKTHHVLAGPAVDLSRFYDREMTPEVLKEATEVIMAAITRQLEHIRGEKAPETPYDPRRERIEQRRRTQAQARAHAQGQTQARVQAQAQGQTQARAQAQTQGQSRARAQVQGQTPARAQAQTQTQTQGKQAEGQST